MVAVSNHIPSVLIPSPPNLEIVAIRLCLPRQRHIILCTVYFPPSSQLSDFEYLFSFLKSTSTSKELLIIIGDFNLPDICWSSLSGQCPRSNLLCDFVFESNLTQLVNFPTHIKGNILDLLLTNNEDLINNLTVVKDDLCLSSDHYKICFQVNYLSSQLKRKVSYVFDYKNGDYDSLSDYLSESDFSQCLHSASIENVWQFIKQSIHNGMNLFIPKVKIRSKVQPKWFNPGIRHSLNCLHTLRKKCYLHPTAANLSKLQSLEHEVKNLMSNAKLQFEQNLALHNCPSAIFRYMKNLTSSSSVPTIVFLDSLCGFSDREKVSMFNTFFHSVFTKSSFQIPPLEECFSDSSTLSDIGISELDVYESLSSLDITKAMGIDGIGPRVLKHCALALYKPIHHLFMLSLSQHYLPLEWRTHLITPVFKSGDKSSVRNYRPISLLCVISKLLEKLVYDKILHFLSPSLSPFQFGFRPKHSSTQQLLSFLNIILQSNSQTDVIYLDFKKAFDSVSHNELLVKLWSIGVTGNLWKWFKAYLFDRWQCVRLNDCVSDLLPVLSGVPQGSILGPLLFLVFINDMPQSISHSNIFLFADDAKCLKTVATPPDCQSLQDDLLQLSTWCNQWKLQFNENKCVLLRFNLKTPTISFNYTVNNAPIQVHNCHRDLGIFISHDLKWHTHINHITSQAYKVLGLIRRSLSTDVNIASKKIMYISLIRPHLTYGSQIWRPHLIKDMIALERIQRRATKYILNDYSSDYKYRLLTLQLLPLMMEFEVYDIMFFIRCFKDSSSSDSFSVLSFIRFSRGTTRASSHLKMIHSLSRTNSASHFYFNRLPRLWNSLPPIDITLSLSAIKKQLRQIFWNHFLFHFNSSNPCSFHYLCPCSKCVSCCISTSYC